MEDKLQEIADSMSHKVETPKTTVYHNNERLGDCEDCGDDGVVFNEEGVLYCEECLYFNDTVD